MIAFFVTKEIGEFRISAFQGFRNAVPFPRNRISNAQTAFSGIETRFQASRPRRCHVGRILLRSPLSISRLRSDFVRAGFGTSFDFAADRRPRKPYRKTLGSGGLRNGRTRALGGLVRSIVLRLRQGEPLRTPSYRRVENGVGKGSRTYLREHRFGTEIHHEERLTHARGGWNHFPMTPLARTRAFGEISMRRSVEEASFRRRRRIGTVSLHSPQAYRRKLSRMGVVGG